MAAEIRSEDLLVVADAAAWRAWLDEHEHIHDGVWLMLSKKGTVSPTSLTYAQALDEALCSGWIDGQKRRYDEAAFLQRFTLSSAGLAARFEALGSQERYAMLHQLMTAPSTEVRARRLERMVLRLSGMGSAPSA